LLENVRYQTEKLVAFYAQHRCTWADFYPSERWIIERIAKDRNGDLGRVLDVGCAVGGFGRALGEKFKVARYVGVDVNAQCIDAAKATAKDFRFPAEFHCQDIVEHRAGSEFDLVASLSCADWNLDPMGILSACWSQVAPGGRLILSLRLTPGKTVNDVSRSYQRVRFDGSAGGSSDEVANYVVFNIADALRIMMSFAPSPKSLLSYGYWGKPSASAATPYERLLFTVFAIEKGGATEVPALEAHWPADALADLGRDHW